MAGVKARELIALDSNFLVAARGVGTSQARELEHWLRTGLIVQISAIAWSEYLCGPLDETDVPIARKFLSTIEPFGEEDAELASELFNKTGRRSCSHVDCMIAAHAIRRNATLATLNSADFRRFQAFNLKLARG